MSAMSMAMQRRVVQSEAEQWLKAILMSLVMFALLVLLISPAFAGGGGPAGGATGTAAATQTRVLGVVTGWQLIMFVIGAFILAGAFMWVGYAMAFGGKRWSDVVNVVYGAMIAGMGPMLVAWFFS